MVLVRSSRAGFETLQLVSPQASVEVCPSRGAIVTSCVLAGDELLFLDSDTFADPAQNVRGGIPLLFPIAGAPPVGTAFKQHGFARLEGWAELEASDDRIVLQLTSSKPTRSAYPSDFELRFTLSLAGPTIDLEWSVLNADRRPMPVQLGIHPYFKVPLAQKAKAVVETDATQVWNNRTGAFETLATAPNFGGADEVDLQLLNHSAQRTGLQLGDGSSVRLKWSPSFHTLVLWSLPGKPFICVEPWSDPSHAARAGRPLPSLAPGETASYSVQISRVA